MGYDIQLTDPNTEHAVIVARHREGGTYALNGTAEARIGITYNYAANFGKVLVEDWADDRGRPCKTFSIRWLYGKTGRETAETLFRVTQQLGTQRDPDYWKATDGNAGYAASVLLTWAIQHPDAVWEGE